MTELREVKAEDIQREKSPPAAWQLVCADCLEKIRSVARLAPQYDLRRAVRDALVLVPVFSILSLSLVAGFAYLSGGLAVGEPKATSVLVGTVIVFTGAGMVWKSFKERYAATHNLRWSFNTRAVLVALSVFSGGIISLIVASYVYA